MLERSWLAEVPGIGGERAAGGVGVLTQEPAPGWPAALGAAADVPGGDAAGWQEVAPGVERRAVAAGPEMALALTRYRRGGVARLHHHAFAQAGYVLAGSLRLTTPDGQRTVGAGESYLLPPGVPHQLRALEPAAAVEAFVPGQAPAAGLAAPQPDGAPAPAARVGRRRSPGALRGRSAGRWSPGACVERPAPDAA